MFGIAGASIRLCFLSMSDPLAEIGFWVNAARVPRNRQVVHRPCPHFYALMFMGGGELRFARGENRPVLLRQPTVFWSDRHTLHHYEPGDCGWWDHSWFGFCGPGSDALFASAVAPLNPDGLLPIRRVRECQAKFAAMIEAVRDPLFSPTRRVLRLMALLDFLQEERGEEEHAEPDPLLAGVRALARRIQDNTDEEPDFRTAAERLHVSYAHFRRVFRRELGRAPKEFWLDCKLGEAAQKLFSGARVQDVAYASGYADPAQFSRMFKRRLGVPPSSLRPPEESLSPSPRAKPVVSGSVRA